MENPNYSEWKATVHNACDSVILLLGAVAAGLALLQKEEKAGLDWPLGLEPLAQWLVRNNWWLLLALMAMAALVKIVKERLERTWIWSAVQAVVDRIQAEAFSGQPGYAHHHRATLFRHQKFLWWPFPVRHWLWPWGLGRWPGSGWLVPVIRSGHATQRSTTYFLAPDDADHFEGVAGHIWNSNKEIALLDSRDPAAALNAQLNITPYAYCLGKLLERV